MMMRMMMMAWIACCFVFFFWIRRGWIRVAAACCTVFTRRSHEGRAAVFTLSRQLHMWRSQNIWYFLSGHPEGDLCPQVGRSFLPFCSISLLWTKKKKKILLRAASHYFSMTFFALFKNIKVRSCFCLVCVVYFYLLTHFFFYYYYYNRLNILCLRCLHVKMTWNTSLHLNKTVIYSHYKLEFCPTKSTTLCFSDRYEPHYDLFIFLIFRFWVVHFFFDDDSPWILCWFLLYFVWIWFISF